MTVHKKKKKSKLLSPQGMSVSQRLEEPRGQFFGINFTSE